MKDFLKKLCKYGIIPVVKIENKKDAIPLGKALISGGIPIAEITFRTKAAEEVIKILSNNLQELIVGAGTVLTIEQAKKAVNAGAKFIVSPGFNPKIVKYCIDNNIPVAPGVNNPSLVEEAIDYGLDVLKFFPAEQSGGVPFLKAISACYSNVKFIPTGGINQDNILNYLNLPNVDACGGSWIVKSNLISENKFDEIIRLTREAIYTMLGFNLAHIGINEENEEKAYNIAKIFSNIFNYPINTGTNSIFLGKEFEIMKKPYLGKHGHIAIATNDIYRALFYLDKMGIKESIETRKEKDGKLKATYLKDEFSGFAIHLLQK